MLPPLSIKVVQIKDFYKHWQCNREKRKTPEIQLPVEGPLEQKEFGGLGEGGAVLVGLQHLRDDAVQPRRPLLKGVLLLEGQFEVLLQSLHHAVFAPAHPRGLLLLEGGRSKKERQKMNEGYGTREDSMFGF